MIRSVQAYLSIFALVVSVALNCVGEKPVGFRTFVHVVLSSDHSHTKGENPKGPHPPHSSLLQFKADCNLFRLMLAGTRITHFDFFARQFFVFVRFLTPLGCLRQSSKYLCCILAEFECTYYIELTKNFFVN